MESDSIQLGHYFRLNPHGNAQTLDIHRNCVSQFLKMNHLCPSVIASFSFLSLNTHYPFYFSCIYICTHTHIHLTHVIFTLCKLYLSNFLKFNIYGRFPFILNSRHLQLICSDRKQISCIWGKITNRHG